MITTRAPDGANNTPPGKKLGLWQRKIYSKLFCWDHNFFHIMICWDHNFFHIMISTSILWFQHPYYDLNIKFLQIMISTANFSKLWSQQCVCLYSSWTYRAATGPPLKSPLDYYTLQNSLSFPFNWISKDFFRRNKNSWKNKNRSIFGHSVRVWSIFSKTTLAALN